MLLLFLFRSVFVPLKALALNVVSLGAMFGAMVWIFQEGHLSGLLDFTPTGTLVDTMPILMFCIAFGLSMDYEVFLVSRIKELADRGLSNEDAIAGGLQKSGRIITAAALLMSVVFFGLVTSGIAFMKLFAVGLTLAVLLGRVHHPRHAGAGGHETGRPGQLVGAALPLAPAAADPTRGPLPG